MNVLREINDLTRQLCQQMSRSGFSDEEQTSHDSNLLTLQDQLSKFNQSLELLKSSASGDKATIESALQSGLPTTGCDSDGSSPLFVAAFHGHTDCLKLFLEHGADPLVNRDDGMTPLMAAAWSGSDDTVKSLMGRLDPLASTSSKGMTALMYAACKGSAGCIRLLIPYGGTDARDFRGYTPLMLAVEQSSSVLAVQELIRHSDLDAKNAAGQDILQISKLKSGPEISHFIAGYKHALFEMTQLSGASHRAPSVSKKSLSL